MTSWGLVVKIVGVAEAWVDRERELALIANSACELLVDSFLPFTERLEHEIEVTRDRVNGTAAELVAGRLPFGLRFLRGRRPCQRVLLGLLSPD